MALDREGLVLRVTSNPLLREAQLGDMTLLAFADRQRHRQRDPRLVCVARHLNGGAIVQYGVPRHPTRAVLCPALPEEHVHLVSALHATFQTFADILLQVDPPPLTLIPNTLVVPTGATVRFVHQGVVLFLCVTSTSVTTQMTRTSLHVYGQERCDAAREALAQVQESASGGAYMDAVRAAQHLVAWPVLAQYAAAQGM